MYVYINYAGSVYVPEAGKGISTDSKIQSKYSVCVCVCVCVWALKKRVRWALSNHVAISQGILLV